MKTNEVAHNKIVQCPSYISMFIYTFEDFGF